MLRIRAHKILWIIQSLQRHCPEANVWLQTIQTHSESNFRHSSQQNKNILYLWACKLSTVTGEKVVLHHGATYQLSCNPAPLSTKHNHNGWHFMHTHICYHTVLSRQHKVLITVAFLPVWLAWQWRACCRREMPRHMSAADLPMLAVSAATTPWNKMWDCTERPPICKASSSTGPCTTK